MTRNRPEQKCDRRIAAIACAHSADTDSRDFFNHTNPDRKSPFDGLRKSYVACFAAAEKIAFGPTNLERIKEPNEDDLRR